MTYGTPDVIYPGAVVATADLFLEACKCARDVLPKLRRGDAKDEALIQQINAAVSQTPVES
jgi:hypothetical protein